MGDTVNDVQKVDSHKHIGEDDVIGLLGDGVTAAILEYVVGTNGCTKEDITEIKAVVKEAQSLLRELENCGLIEIKGDTAEVTEKGRKFLEHLKGIEESLIQRASPGD
ncbi:MAG: hypothetical protein AYK18_16715 [Theionarchaea archaeon DG-70]|nr:MAG: hypothetical protein AYK18_16715 [Theionarchaea archaeon DG-70]